MGTSEQSSRNMNRFCIALAFVACAYGAPTADYAHAGLVGHAGLGYAGHAGLGYAGGLVGAPVASAPAVVGQTHASNAAGPPVVENRVEYGLVGQRTVQVGVQQVVAGHAYAVAGHEAIPSLPILMLPDLPRTLLTPLPFPLQSSLLPQHLMLPSPLHPSQLALLPLTPLSSRESLLPLELTPESPP